MTESSNVRPPFDPELATFLATMGERGRPVLTREMLPRMRELEVTEEELDARLRSRGLERRSYRVPGHLGVPIDLAVVQRRGRTGSAPCFYAIHGGGMMFGHHLGNLDSYDDWLLTHDVVLVSVDYRLAPEHPDPTPVEDCYAGLLWTVAHAELLGIDPALVVLVGQSAGGGLAAGCALLARDRQGPRVLAQILVSPMLDDSGSTVSTRQIDGVGVADRGLTRFAWDAYLGERRGGDDVSVYAAPARATDLSGLPRRTSTARAPRCSATRRWPTRAGSGLPASKPSCTSGPAGSTASRAWCRRRRSPAPRPPRSRAGLTGSSPADQRRCDRRKRVRGPWSRVHTARTTRRRGGVEDVPPPESLPVRLHALTSVPSPLDLGGRR